MLTASEEWIAVEEEAEITQYFSDQQIIDSVINPEKVNDDLDGSDEDENVPKKKISLAVAEECMETLQSFIEQIPNFSAQEVIQAHRLQNAMINKKQACTKQGDIRNFKKKMISANSQESFASTSGINRDGTTEADMLEDN
jgi:hypothetical protein